MTKRTLWLATAIITSIALWGSPSSAQIQPGNMVTFDYTLTDDGGTLLNSSKGKKPLTYQHGKGAIIPGLEKALTGMKPGQKKIVTVTPENAYGSVNPQNVKEVSKDELPKKNLKVGDMIVAVGKQGQRRPVKVSQVKDKTVVVDFNHPLAGRTLIFDIRIVDVKPGK